MRRLDRLGEAGGLVAIGIMVAVPAFALWVLSWWVPGG